MSGMIEGKQVVHDFADGEMGRSMKITQEMKFEFDERCAIFEVDGGFTRGTSEWKALNLMQKKYGTQFNMNDFKEETK